MPDGQNTNGIGAAVKRREDFRFLTGQGRYTDDINRPGQTYAYILARTRRTPRSRLIHLPPLRPMVSSPSLPAMTWSRRIAPMWLAGRLNRRHTHARAGTPATGPRFCAPRR